MLLWSEGEETAFDCGVQQDIVKIICVGGTAFFIDDCPRWQQFVLADDHPYLVEGLPLFGIKVNNLS